MGRVGTGKGNRRNPEGSIRQILAGRNTGAASLGLSTAIARTTPRDGGAVVLTTNVSTLKSNERCI